MGLLLRKKTSKPNLKNPRVPTPPPQLPPLPGHIRRAEDAAAAAGGSPPKANLSPGTPHYLRRRSRSLWAASDEAKAALAARPVNDASGAGDLASQPWRNASTWAALHSPSRPPSVLNTLINPNSPSMQAPGWRGRGGGGFFTSAGMDNEITNRSDRTPGSATNGTPGRTPMSPSRRARAVITPSATARRLDFGSSSPDVNAASFSSSSPIPITPRSMRRRSASMSELTPAAVVTGSSPATPGLLTPTSTNILPSLSRTPSPITRDSLASVSSSSSKPSPTRALPLAPTDSDGEPDSFHSATGDDENETEIIDFSKPTPMELAAASINTPLRRDNDLPKRSGSSGRSGSTGPSGSVPPSPGLHSAFPTTSPSQRYSPLPAHSNLPSPGQQFAPLPVAPVERVPPHPALAAPTSFTPSPPSAAFIQPRQVSNSSTSSHTPSNQSHGPTRTASSSSQARSASSAGHHEPPHTPDGIAHAINVWRRKSLRRDAPVPARTSMSKAKEVEQQWPNSHPDVFAPTGAWEAQGAYNPYEESAFTDEPEFTPPVRLPVMPREQQQQQAPHPQAQAQRLPRPSQAAPRMNIMQMQARRPSAGGVRQVPPASQGRRAQVSQQWI